MQISVIAVVVVVFIVVALGLLCCQPDGPQAAEFKLKSPQQTTTIERGRGRGWVTATTTTKSLLPARVSLECNYIWKVCGNATIKSHFHLEYLCEAVARHRLSGFRKAKQNSCRCANMHSSKYKFSIYVSWPFKHPVKDEIRADWLTGWLAFGWASISARVPH